MEITSEKVEIPTPGDRMPAHLARPATGGRFPAVVVIMEAFGLVPHIERVAERIAAEGYLAVAADFYYRMLPRNKVGYDDLQKAIGLMQALDDAEFLDDMRATLDYLEARDDTTDRVGVTGFCMGGRLAFLTACELPDRITCAAPFYGGGIATHLPRADRIRAPMLLFFGERDTFIPMDQVRRIEARLSELGKDARVEVYPGAEHGFFCDERASYDAKAAEDAWGKLRALFARHLRD